MAEDKEKLIKKPFDFDDVFTFSEIIDKMDIEADFEKISKSIQTIKLENKKDASKLGKEVIVSLGIDIIMKMIRRFYMAKDEVKQLIASLTLKSKKDVGKMSFAEIKDFFIEMFGTEGFEDFFRQAGESTEPR